MSKRHIPNEPEIDRIVYGRPYSLRLAIRLGSEEQAQVLHLIHTKLKWKADHPEQYEGFYVEGRWWTADPFRVWSETYFPFAREETVRVSFFMPLIKSGLLIQNNFDYGLSRRSWFSIDYELLHERFPFLKETYPDVNGESHHAERGIDKGNNVIRNVTVTLPTLNGESYHAEQGNDTTLNEESIIYINNKDSNTVFSTNTSSVISSISGEKESVREKTIESELNKFLEDYRNLTGTDYKDPEAVKELLRKGNSVDSLLEPFEVYYSESSELPF